MTRPDIAASRVAIGVCTCNRPLQLRRLMTTINALKLRVLRDDQIELIVVDNGINESARSTFDTCAPTSRFSPRYVAEPRRGLAYARNTLIDSAITAGASHLALIDDDETPHPDWLEKLIEASQQCQTGLVVGPTQPVFDRPPPRWLPIAAYETRAKRLGQFSTVGYTGNALIDLTLVQAEGVRFDHRFNGSGGEDTAFFKTMTERGHRIAWAEDAIIYEYIPEHRMRFSWLLKRWYMTGLNEGHIAQAEKGPMTGKLRNFARGSSRIVAGSVRIFGSCLLFGWRKPDAVVQSFYTALRGIGYLAASLGRQERPYAGPDNR